ncbi:MAG TPA: hypothetical protein PLT86_14965, partial [Candidatus Latescibacteria bacterium]|nr:hypothetical protein [Candidatus Latescibacterota bacterium]
VRFLPRNTSTGNTAGTGSPRARKLAAIRRREVVDPNTEIVQVLDEPFRFLPLFPLTMTL